MRAFRTLKGFYALLAMMIAVLLMFLFPLTKTYGEGSLGILYSQVLSDVSLGITGAYETDTRIGELELNGQVQSGDLYLGDAHLNLTFGLGRIGLDAIGIRPYIDITGKADTLDAIGYKTDYGLTANVDLHTETDTEAGVGFFKRQANPFTPKILYERVDGEYQPVDSGFGINYDNPAPWNLLGFVGFEVFGQVNAKVSGSMGLGIKDTWLTVDLSTGWELPIGEFTVGLNIGNRWWEDDAGESASKADVALLMGVSHQWE